MMLAAYPDAYDVDSDEATEPDEGTVVAVLGKSHANEDLVPDDLRMLFEDYHDRFGLGSKPAAHLAALADLSDEQLLDDLPDVLGRLVGYAQASLDLLPE